LKLDRYRKFCYKNNFNKIFVPSRNISPCKSSGMKKTVNGYASRTKTILYLKEEIIKIKKSQVKRK
jgi:hypothetical protein